MDQKVNSICGISLTPLRVIPTKGGDVMHCLKATDHSFKGFGEAYFSTIDKDAIKAWKRHREMTLNLVVPNGAVRFVIYDDRSNSSSKCLFQEVILSSENYMRLTIPPMVWVGFQGISNNRSYILNVADIAHNEDEIERKELSNINFNWGKS